MNYTGPKVRQSRRLGVVLTPKADKVMQKKNYPPGQHGNSGMRRGKESVYKRQLVEKQRLRFFYNIHERQMRNIFRKAARKQLNTADGMIQSLETRLDAVVTRGGFARTIYQGRKLVAHGHCLINGKKVDIPSYSVQPGDVITIREKSRKIKDMLASIETAVQTAAHLELDKEAISIKLLALPKSTDIPVVRDLELSLVVEYYSR